MKECDMMKIKRLAKNKVRILLSHRELEAFGIVWENIGPNDPATQEWIALLLDAADRHTGFYPEDGHLYVEAVPTDEGYAVILSTIAPEKEETEQSVLSPLVFLFENAADLTAGARRLYQQYAHRIYQSALYQNGEEYLLVLRPLDRCSMESSLLLSEYGTPVAEGELSAAVIDEHCTSLYTSEALEHLSNEGV